jgi:hypothetical protein
MPRKYVDCKGRVRSGFHDQWQSLGMTEPVDYQIRLYVLAWGRHSRRGDMVDNIPGTIADCLVEAEVISDDNAKRAPGALYDMVYCQSPPRFDILIAPWMPLAESMEQFAEIIDWLRLARG